MLEGDPRDVLLALARRRNTDLIAIGTHGRHGLDRLLVGCDAEGVLRTAPVPVVVVRRSRQAVKNHALSAVGFPAQ